MAHLKPEYVMEKFALLPGEYQDWFLMPWAFLDEEQRASAQETYEDKWFYRLSASGYLDCTEWIGPFDTMAQAQIECEKDHDIDPVTGDELPLCGSESEDTEYGPEDAARLDVYKQVVAELQEAGMLRKKYRKVSFWDIVAALNKKLDGKSAYIAATLRLNIRVAQAEDYAGLPKDAGLPKVFTTPPITLTEVATKRYVPPEGWDEPVTGIDFAKAVSGMEHPFGYDEDEEEEDPVWGPEGPITLTEVLTKPYQPFDNMMTDTFAGIEGEGYWCNYNEWVLLMDIGKDRLVIQAVHSDTEKVWHWELKGSGAEELDPLSPQLIHDRMSYN